jgi:hypothetical protein
VQAEGTGPTRAKNSVQAVSVGNRARGDYESLGVRAGSYFFYPFVLETFSYDDNVLSSKTNKVDDWFITSSPTLLMLSNWGRHQLDFQFGLTDYRYMDQTSENHTDFYAGSDWRIDVTRDFNLAGTLKATKLAEARGDADTSTAAAEPTEYRQYDATLSVNKQFNRLSVHVGGGIQAYDYDDVAAVGGGTIDQDNRDGRIYSAVGKLAYEFSPGYRMFGLVQGNQRDFGDDATDDRDSKGLEARAGVEFEVTRLVKGEISAGYMTQTYDWSSFDDVGTYALSGSLLWNPTQLMTVSLSANRRISETTVATSSGHVDTILKAGVDYEVLRNLIASPWVSYTLEDYQDIDREDKTLSTGLSLQVLLNRHISAGAYYTFTTKDSDVDTYDYDKNVVGGTLKIQY